MKFTPRTARGRLALALCITLPAAAAVSLTLAASGASPVPGAARPAAVHASLPGCCWIGVREPRQPGSWAGFDGFTKATGVRPRLALYYSAWFEPFQAAFARQARARGVTVLVQIQPWGGANLARIAAGDFDRYLRSYADAVRAFGHPVIIGFGHEMNGSWYPWGYGHAPAVAFVAAWRHVVDVFRQQGAGNVTWLWTVSRDNQKSSGDITAYWPGSSYVNWVGIDGYYYTRADTFSRVYGQAVRRVRKLTGDPVLLAEAGIGQVAGQARRIPGLFRGIRRDHLAGLVWYDVPQHDGLYHQDWRLGSRAAKAAFRRSARSYLRGWPGPHHPPRA